MSNNLEKIWVDVEKKTNRGLWKNEKYNAWDSKLTLTGVNDLVDEAVGRVSELGKPLKNLSKMKPRDQEMKSNIQRLKLIEDKQDFNTSQLEF